jgi:hypothetical protein
VPFPTIHLITLMIDRITESQRWTPIWSTTDIWSTRLQRFVGYSNLTSFHGLGTTLDHVISVARSLYRCNLACRDAFPSSKKKAEWATAVWTDACTRTTTYPCPSPQPELVGFFFSLKICTASRGSLVCSRQHASPHRDEDEDHARSRDLLRF